jgi:hypothetical protein
MMDGRLCTHSWLRRWLVPLVCIVPTPLAAAPPARAPARAFPSSIFRDKNRRGIGESQSKWTDSKMETPGSPS